ncbi:oxygenase MpaB family protein [Nocardia inohanensis]|uniref:oxygenase MpaB family protein n=1 Tax=Nocardia inohanensis TaxID=209246 RepID=UPI00083724E0|nr:oxygenase MpaB family protein [Nocardia inohanensis]
MAQPDSAAVRPELGPESLLWRYAGDWRSVVEGTSAGVLQLMYPALGAAVARQSEFFGDPFGRIYRSVPQIWATIFAGDHEVRGVRIRELHRDIKGVMGSGERYHALDPGTFWWAHATFTWLIFRSVELYYPAGELDDAGRERLYRETVEWYRRYGVSMRPVPEDYAAFRAAFTRICLEELELTPAARRALEIAEFGEPEAIPVLPAGVARALRRVLRPWSRGAVVGGLPPEVRERFGLRWSRGDERRDRFTTGVVRVGFRVLPGRVNRGSFSWAIRLLGARTRSRRFAR